MSHCAYASALRVPGEKSFGDYIDQWSIEARRPGILKKAVHLTDRTVDTLLYSYKVARNDQLESVNVRHRAVLVRCGGIQTISAGELVLKGSQVSGDVTVQGGVLKIENSEVNGTLTFAGKKAVLKSVKIAKLVLRIAEGLDCDKFVRELVCSNCKIGEIVIFEGKNTVNLKLKNTDFEKIEKISEE